MKKFTELNELVLQWANDKGILEKATPLTQLAKTEEEVAETREALFASKQGLYHYLNSTGDYKNTQEEIKDGFGDILVTILIGCKLSGLDPLDCLETAYNVISKRTGKMINGTFVKD
jgi:NTP pyrophosphatase (non-canonical NTP hydrolase)